jgi:hypothetical protein
MLSQPFPKINAGIIAPSILNIAGPAVLKAPRVFRKILNGALHKSPSTESRDGRAALSGDDVRA